MLFSFGPIKLSNDIENKKTAWLVAAPEDFIETQTSTKDLSFVLEELYSLFPAINLSFVLWPDENGLINALAQARQTEILQRINDQLSGVLKNDKLLIKTGRNDVKLIKDDLDRLLNPAE